MIRRMAVVAGLAGLSALSALAGLGSCLAVPSQDCEYDEDGDGFPGPTFPPALGCCGARCLPSDCNDQDPSIHPNDPTGQLTVDDQPNDGIDSNCNGSDAN